MTSSKAYLKSLFQDIGKSLFLNILSILSIGIILWLSLYISNISIEAVKSEQILSLIRQNLVNKETNYEINKLNFRWIWDESIIVTAYENIDESLDKQGSNIAQKTYPGVYIFSKADTLFTPLLKVIFWDFFYKKEFELEFLASEANEYFAAGAFDRLEFKNLKSLSFGDQKIIVFSLYQSWFTNSSTHSYYWLIRYDMNLGMIVVESLLKNNSSVSLNNDDWDIEYLKKECKKIKVIDSSLNCDRLEEEPPFSEIDIRVKLNWKIENIKLVSDSEFTGSRNLFISPNWNRITTFWPLYWITDNECFQCPHDYIVWDFIFSQGRYKLVNKSFLRKSSKSFDRDLIIFREDAEFNNREIRPEL